MDATGVILKQLGKVLCNFEKFRSSKCSALYTKKVVAKETSSLIQTKKTKVKFNLMTSTLSFIFSSEFCFISLFRKD